MRFAAVGKPVTTDEVRIRRMCGWIVWTGGGTSGPEIRASRRAQKHGRSAVMMSGVDVDWLERELLRGTRVVEGSPSNSLHSYYRLTLIPKCLPASMPI